MTVWQNEGFGTSSWRGDVQRWGKYFEPGAGYVQGDAAIRHADGAFTFHGRSDEVRPHVSARAPSPSPPLAVPLRNLSHTRVRGA